ncbi:MAG TPA: PqiC family protein [Candidatus Binataceae bacterium]
MNIRAALIAVSAFFIAAGCSPLAPQPDRSRFFILTPISAGAPAAAVQAPSASTQQLTIGVGPIDFPDYLRRLEVVTRASPNQLDLSSEKRWGEPLDKNFARVLSENLAQLLDDRKIEKYPWPRRTEVDYQVTVDVQRFETGADGQTQLDARWIIKDGRSGKDLYASETSSSTPVAAGDAGASAALSSDLATLSSQIASRITDLSQSGTRTTSSSDSQAAAITQ